MTIISITTITITIIAIIIIIIMTQLLLSTENGRAGQDRVKAGLIESPWVRAA